MNRVYSFTPVLLIACRNLHSDNALFVRTGESSELEGNRIFMHH